MHGKICNAVAAESKESEKKVFQGRKLRVRKSALESRDDLSMS